MNTPTPLIIDETLPLHTYLELINDAAFDPIYVPDTEAPEMKEEVHLATTRSFGSRFARLLRALPLI